MINKQYIKNVFVLYKTQRACVLGLTVRSSEFAYLGSVFMFMFFLAREAAIQFLVCTPERHKSSLSTVIKFSLLEVFMFYSAH